MPNAFLQIGPRIIPESRGGVKTLNGVALGDGAQRAAARGHNAPKKRREGLRGGVSTKALSALGVREVEVGTSRSLPSNP